MPIARIQLPDGRIARFEVAEGTSPQEIESFAAQQIQQQEQPSLGRRALGKTGEFLGELGPGLGELFQGAFQLGAELSGREDIAKRIGEGIKEEREKLTGAQRAGRIAGQIIPFAPAGVATGARTAAALGGGVAARVAGAGTAGAVGAGELAAISPTTEGTLPARGREILQSGALGALGGSALSGVSQAARGVRQLFRARKPEDILAARLPKEQTNQLLQQLKTATPDSPVILPDIAGDEVKGLTRAVGKLSGAKDIVSDTLEKRAEGAVTRVTNQLSKDISSIDTYFGSLDDITKARSKIASPLYKKAFEESENITSDKINRLLGDDRIKRAVNTAKRDFGVRPDSNINSLETLDGVKKALDDTIGEAIRQGKNNKVRAFSQLKNELVGELDQISPTYKKARGVFSDFTSVQKAQEQGVQFNKLQPEQLKKLFKDLSVSEKDAFRIGVRENLRKAAEETGRTGAAAARVLKNQNIENRLRVIMGNKFDPFKKRMAEEIAASDTKFKVLGGSRTDINLAAEQEFLSKLAQTGGAVVTGGKLPLIGAAVNAIKNRFGGISEKNAKALANILVKRENSINALQNILTKEQNQIQKRLISEYVNTIRPEIAITQTIQQKTEN
jgi:hypothetical protein